MHMGILSVAFNGHRALFQEETQNQTTEKGRKGHTTLGFDVSSQQAVRIPVFGYLRRREAPRKVDKAKNQSGYGEIRMEASHGFDNLSCLTPCLN